MEDALVLAYLAGCIDSDGSITVRRSTYGMRVTGDARVPVFSEKVSLKQVTPQVPNLLKERFGGCLMFQGPSVTRGRSLYAWQISNLQAAVCIAALLPYLRIKRAQAENCIELRRVKEEAKAQRIGRGLVRSEAHNSAMEHHYSRNKELNAVGIA